MNAFISAQTLYEKSMAAKVFLNRELTKIRLKQENDACMTAQEITTRLDLIHEIERKGFRYLDERGERKLTKLMNEIEGFIQNESQAAEPIPA